MRLTCPNCAAQYELASDAIPDAGREVRCSACETTWFAAGTGERLAPLALGAVKDPLAQVVSRLVREEPSADPPPRPKLDQSVLDILHEEAARETRARIAEGSMPAPVDVADHAPDETVRADRRRGGFWFGFCGVLLFVAIALGVYLYAKENGAASPALAGYVAWGDGVHVWFHSVAGRLF